MAELEKITQELMQKMGICMRYYVENTHPKDIPVCDRAFEGYTDDGQYTYFRFLYKNVGYIGVLDGAGETQKNYAVLLPSFIESFSEKETELSKTEFLKRILLGECSSMSIYKYMTKYSLKGAPCFAIALRIPKLMKETLSVLEQYGGNSLDTAVQMNEDTCVLVKFAEEGSEYRSSVDYAEFLVQSLKEELGLDACAGVGQTVRELKDIGLSYTGAENTLRYADVFELQGNVHSYREFLLAKLLEDIPESKLAEYLSEMSETSFKEVFEDEEMLCTAETFLQCSLNVSETSRNLYMHRNTLLYRLDKIEKATGLNIRSFSDAVSFRVLTILHRLIKK
ncbi:MAG: helix-turn-helix domain-containing protein [Clostridia bacterium]|nr:helix-turn-helix domain-containing protein [Clostridia bacterium]MBQ7831614.1 helix-turn-helix domain-containing protein [Clostridia bacterium]